MSKAERRWVCQECGWSFARQMGRCPHCGAWGSLVETIIEEEKGRTRISSRRARSRPAPLDHIEGEREPRLPVPMTEFARVLGGGLVFGSMVLIGGEPGIGKSTLLLQLADQLGDGTHPILYVSGEESPRQVKMRARRLGLSGAGIHLFAETSVERIIEEAEAMLPDLRALIVDSIQTARTESLDSAAGSVSQVRTCATLLQRWAKQHSVPVLLVGHVTKEGAIAGPKVLEHIVDTVLYLEGDPFHTYRILRSVKNRFGATSEVGLFEMREEGMVEVANPSEAFRAERMVNVPGSAIAVTMEGTRPLLVEIQALASPTNFNYSRRTVNGLDYNRLLLIIAVLTRRAGLRMGDQDIFANVVGGLQLREPAIDLAVAAALASTVKDRPVAADVVLIGEIGLSGEVRSVSQIGRRVAEAGRLGFHRVIVPRTSSRNRRSFPQDVEVIAVRSVREAIEAALL